MDTLGQFSYERAHLPDAVMIDAHQMDWAQAGYDFEGNQAKEMKQKWSK